jgi:Collagen triple helix repeat (20 copies)/BspA type Leucine rich repeat region (6 copies)
MTSVLHPTTPLPMNLPSYQRTLLAPFVACILFFAAGLISLHAQSQTSGTTPDGYTWTSDGISVTITGGTPGMTNLTIPSSINGLPVVCIGTNAFCDQIKYSNVITLTIPNTVQTIMANSFSGCINIAYLTIPDSVCSFGYNSFGIGVGSYQAFTNIYQNGQITGSIYSYYQPDPSSFFTNYPYQLKLISCNASAEMKKFLNSNSSQIGIVYTGYVKYLYNTYWNYYGSYYFNFGPVFAPLDINKTTSFSDVDYSNIASNSIFLSALTTAITNSSSSYGILQRGLTGATGANGPQGPAGINGTNGVQGPQGPKGDKGDTGAQGPMGLTGPQGPAGVNGANGAQGPVGPQGAQGPQGATGTFDPTVLTNTAFLNGLATNQAFISAMTTNPAFLAAIAQGIAGSTNNYGFYLKQSQNLNFPAIAPIPFSYGKTMKLTVTSSAGLTPVVFSSANPGVATVSNNVLTVTGSGTTTVTASQAGNLSTAPVSVSQNFVVTPVLQTLKFSSIAPQTYALGKTLTLSVTSSAKLSPITFTSSNEGVATVSNNVLTLVGRGTSVITANQAGDGNNTSASAVQILTVN